MLNGQDVFCVSATGSGKSALLYLASIAGEGTIITLAVSPTNFLGSDWVQHAPSLTPFVSDYKDLFNVFYSLALLTSFKSILQFSIL